MSAAQVQSLQPDSYVQEPRVCQIQRRLHQRFPITAQAEYIVDGNRAQATTRDISSGGVFLNTYIILHVGKPIQVLIDWPVLLDDRCPLRLVVCGKVLRSDWAGTAVGIMRYEFRVRARKVVRLLA
jgi:PilZ domain